MINITISSDCTLYRLSLLSAYKEDIKHAAMTKKTKMIKRD